MTASYRTQQADYQDNTKRRLQAMSAPADDGGLRVMNGLIRLLFCC